MDKICEMIDTVNQVKKEKCTSECKYYEKAFDHNVKACTLSDVYSVKKGELCSTFERKKS
jgi:hypothetical protein